MDSIPIQGLVDQTKSFFAKRLIEYLLAQALIAAPFLGWSFILPLLRQVVEWGVNKALDYLDGKLFNLNMDILTSDQASDYRKTVAAILTAPDDISDAEWIKLEEAANHKFDELIRLSK